ncbi:MAG: prepilin-type N-terminal cleavage/methylation domain-containing protein [Gemmatimonadales bacterium]|nr:prepilin-type N-terminal cleavage/methylation domain-containing protein [Gemmatimonadales bacterium]
MRSERGFTLIELLIVVVIIGILAAIAIPKFANTKEKAYIAAMKSDLRNLVTAEESYNGDNASYTSALASLQYQASSGVTVTIGAADAIGWNATAKHNGTTRTCGIFYGTSTAPIAGQNEGEPKCQ